MLKDCHDKYKTQEVYDKAVDSCLLALKFVPDWFVKNEMIEKLDSVQIQTFFWSVFSCVRTEYGDLWSKLDTFQTVVFSNDYIVFRDLDSYFFTFFSIDIGLNIIALDDIDLDDYYFDYLNPETINHVKLMAWHNK